MLTDTPSFHGVADDLMAARHARRICRSLRKDFMLDPYQIVQSRALGADCILLIIAMLTDGAAAKLIEEAHEWGSRMRWSKSTMRKSLSAHWRWIRS